MITNVVTPQYRSGHLVKAFVSALGHVRTSLLVLFPQCQACSLIFHLNFYHLSFCKHNSIVTLSHYAKKKKKKNWPKSSFSIFHTILWKDWNELFGQPNRCSKCHKNVYQCITGSTCCFDLCLYGDRSLYNFYIFLQ